MREQACLKKGQLKEKGALMSSALLMNSSQLLDGEDADSHSVAYSGALRALPPGGRTA